MPLFCAVSVGMHTNEGLLIMINVYGDFGILFFSWQQRKAKLIYLTDQRVTVSNYQFEIFILVVSYVS